MTLNLSFSLLRRKDNSFQKRLSGSNGKNYCAIPLDYWRYERLFEEFQQRLFILHDITWFQECQLGVFLVSRFQLALCCHGSLITTYVSFMSYLLVIFLCRRISTYDTTLEMFLGAIFIWVSKVIGLASTIRYTTGWKNSRHFFIRSEVKP